ncbi:MAG TPA: 3-oxoacyl-[acyl-carrier-protein] synthase III C-terminal domain-containing protein, partial [Candidatus Dormibacteraeota bacterium]|nr:3-oxoacyl-[acyl-carrier-protein] synthase III C-terminal domain-containing protein [Candidatus Dormibacteraeota bacterium]
VLDETGVDPASVELLIFASASQDMLEPATANMVQEKVGTACPVFDVKNACNSFLCGLQAGEALVLTGSARSVLVTTGEIPSRSIKWTVESRTDLKSSFPGYILGDAGAAALLVASDDERGILHRSFQTVSRYWHLATIPGGGSAHPRGDEYSYFQSNGSALRDAFVEMGTGPIQRVLDATATTFEDYRCILVHQVALPYLKAFLAATGVPEDRVQVTLPELGNIASATLPVGFAQAEAMGRVAEGDLALWIGLASGISAGVIAMRY